MRYMNYDDFKWTSTSRRRNKLTAYYEPLQMHFLDYIAAMGEECIFLDVGSNVGAYSIMLSGNHNIKKIYAIEALPECVNEIKKNVLENKLDSKIAVIHQAVSDAERNVVFLRTKAFGGDSGILDSYMFGRNSGNEEINVLTKKLDDIIRDNYKNVVIKIDVEGHEYEVLKGASDLLSEKKGWIQCEIHESSPNKAALIGLLEGIGWKKVFALDWDYYFTNHTEYHNPTKALELMESLSRQFIAESRESIKPRRFELLPGIIIEISKGDGYIWSRLVRCMKSLAN